MHYSGALFQIQNGFVVILAINVKYGSVEIEIFLVENVLLIIICILGILFLVITASTLIKLIRVVSGLKSFQLFPFAVIKIANVFVIIAFIMTVIILLLDSESEIVFSTSFRIVSLDPILLFSPSNGSDFVHLCPVSARNDLTVVVKNRRLMSNLLNVFILFISNQL